MNEVGEKPTWAGAVMCLLVRELIDEVVDNIAPEPDERKAPELDMTESERIMFEHKWESKFREALKDEARAALGVTL